ncbi:MAG: hypothetical protein ACRD6B_01145 [Bryobacteraceae bacterium]
MKKTVEEICAVIDACSETEQRAILSHIRKRFSLHPLESEWDINAETILSAINRSSDLTLRGIRGIIAEATFADFVVPTLASIWDVRPIEGDQPYDFFLKNRNSRMKLRIQVKLQRREKQEPKKASNNLRRPLTNPPEILYVVEVQRTRTGKRAVKSAAGQVNGETTLEVEQTRPYRFGEFDILAVNMHPSTKDWRRFMYTVGNWLLPRAEPLQNLIQIMQPVAAASDRYWTDDIDECIDWFLSQEKRRLYDR